MPSVPAIRPAFLQPLAKIGCQSRGVAVSLSPGKGYTVTPAKIRKNIAEKHLSETIAFYQQASEKSQTQENEQ